MAVSVKVIDRGFNKLVREFNALKTQAVCAVGIQGELATGPREEANGPTNVEIGLAHEFGKGRIPERSHLRSTFDENEKRYRDELTRIAAEFESVARARGDVLMIGAEYHRNILSRLKEGIAGGAKGVVRHLRETGQYWKSITVVMDPPESFDE